MARERPGLRPVMFNRTERRARTNPNSLRRTVDTRLSGFGTRVPPGEPPSETADVGIVVACRVSARTPMTTLVRQLREAEAMIRHTAELLVRLRAADQRTRVCLARSLEAFGRFQSPYSVHRTRAVFRDSLPARRGRDGSRNPL